MSLSIDGWVKYKDLWDKGELNGAQQKKFIEFDTKLRNEMAETGQKLPKLKDTISKKGLEFTALKPVETIKTVPQKLVSGKEFQGLQQLRQKAASLLKAEGKVVSKEAIEKVMKRLPAILSKGASAAGKVAAKSLVPVIEMFDAEGLADSDPSSLGAMIENPDFSALQRFQAQEVIGEPQTLEGKNYTDYALLDQLKLDRDFKDAVGENPRLEALGRSIASEEAGQVDRLINRLGQRPSEDTIGDEGSEMDEVLEETRGRY